MKYWMLIATLSGGCVVYDEQTRSDSDDTDPSAPSSIALWLNPANGIPGEIAILSLYSNEAIDLQQVTEVQFFGPSTVSVLATDIRSEHEFLLAIDIADDAVLGTESLLVKFNGGIAVYVDDAFQVVTDASDIPVNE